MIMLVFVTFTSWPKLRKNGLDLDLDQAMATRTAIFVEDEHTDI